jgi:hypothetical protein
MRTAADLLAEEPIALTGAVTATGNVLILMGVGHLSPEVIAGLNVMVGAWLALLRWLVVPNKVAQQQADTAVVTGYTKAIADVHELAPAKPAKKVAKK